MLNKSCKKNQLIKKGYYKISEAMAGRDLFILELSVTL